MKIDMSPEVVAHRLKPVNKLRKACLSLAGSGAGKDILKENRNNDTVRRTARAPGHRTHD
ncbi:MAG: hypothetical protein PHF23_05235 [Smithellaceae bacterium]|nr:hypothetical protein [Smithellaceae bacterium]